MLDSAGETPANPSVMGNQNSNLRRALAVSCEMYEAR